MEVNKESLEKALIDWQETLDFAENNTLNELYKKAIRLYTENGLCYYFNNYNFLDEFILSECEYISVPICASENIEEAILGIKERIKVIKILLKRCQYSEN